MRLGALVLGLTGLEAGKRQLLAGDWTVYTSGEADLSIYASYVHTALDHYLLAMFSPIIAAF
jgi:hypothetical protein